MRELVSGENNKQKWTIEATCSGEGWDQEGKTPCFSLFELDGRDIQYRDHTDYGGYTDRYYGFTCPKCNCFTEISDSKIPSYIRNIARKYCSKSEEL